MGKGSRRHRTTNSRKKKMQKKSQNKKYTTIADLNPKETKTDTSSDEQSSSSSGNAILMPGTEEYKTAWEQVCELGKPGPPTENFCTFPAPVQLELLELDKETIMAAKTGSIDPKSEDKKVLMFRDHCLVFPELWMNVLVVGPPVDTRGFNHLFARGYCKKANSIEDADLVVFTGGPDVDPSYYGEEPHDSCYLDPERDYADIGMYLACLDAGVAMTGVCRGAQFLAVMNGYKLFQDVDGHQGEHKMWCQRTKTVIDRVSSVHHQSVRPGQGLEILGWSNVSTIKHLNPKKTIEARNKNAPLLDVEAYFIRDTCCLGVQGHPEYKGYNAFAKWYLETIYNYIYLNPDFDWEEKTGRLRMRESIREERKFTCATQIEPDEIITVVEGAK